MQQEFKYAQTRGMIPTAKFRIGTLVMNKNVLAPLGATPTAQESPSELWTTVNVIKSVHRELYMRSGDILLSKTQSRN